MIKSVIKLENVTKIYRIYKHPLDRLKEIIFRSDYAFEKVALKDISFEIYKGEAVGIIGENGAGKSTLLSIIAGTLSPTFGKVNVDGKVGSILELGAGFHPELSGIENVYIYGSMFGLSKKYIDSIIEEIRDFSELGDYINQPIKTYSSGMVVRLAFSTIVNLNPDIFIIDEALSVGDVHFQKKSFDRIRQFKEEGNTILFTTHNLFQVLNLCERAIWIKDGKIEKIGNSLNVVKAFEDYMREKDKKEDQKPKEVKHSPNVYIKEVKFNKTTLKPGDVFVVDITICSKEKENIIVGVHFSRNDDIAVFMWTNKHENMELIVDKELKVRFIFEDFPVLYGSYRADIYLVNETADVVYEVKPFNIEVEKVSIFDIGMIRYKGKIEVL